MVDNIHQNLLSRWPAYCLGPLFLHWVSALVLLCCFHLQRFPLFCDMLFLSRLCIGRWRNRQQWKWTNWSFLLARQRQAHSSAQGVNVSLCTCQSVLSCLQFLRPLTHKVLVTCGRLGQNCGVASPDLGRKISVLMSGWLVFLGILCWLPFCSAPDYCQAN